MNILIDSGNTQCKFAVYANGELQRISKEEALRVFGDIDCVVYSDVANSVELKEFLIAAQDVGVPVKSVSVTKQAFGVECAYKNFETLGIDRWLSILGAEKLLPNKNVIVMDAGTAITVDILTKNKAHIGGWITPGLKLLEETIIEKAPNVFSSNEANYEPFGTSTPNALRSGCVNAAVGLIQRAIDLYKIDQKDTTDPTVLLTGGDAELISNQLKITHMINNDLVFIGLARFI